MLGIQLLFSMIALSVLTKLTCSSIRRLPLNGDNEVTVFEGRPIGTGLNSEEKSINTLVLRLLLKPK